MTTTHTFIQDGDRYMFDHRLSLSLGWAQLDSRQDAWYYGCWINAAKRQIVEYAEGDVSRYTFDSDAEMFAWLDGVDGRSEERRFSNGKAIAIDPGLPETSAFVAIVAACRAAGIGAFLHS